MVASDPLLAPWPPCVHNMDEHPLKFSASGLHAASTQIQVFILVQDDGSHKDDGDTDTSDDHNDIQ